MEKQRSKASEAYLKKLRDPRWQRKRLEVLQRDDFTCQFCYDKESTLHIHHLEYVWGRDPWEYENSFLLTLCEACHEFEQERPEIEKKLLRGLRLAGLSAEQLDCLACPTPFGSGQYRNLFQIFTFILNADSIQPASMLGIVDELRAKLATLYETRVSKPNSGGEGNA